MSLIGNILWIILGGFLAFLGYVVGGVVLCITIIGIPFGVQCFKIAVLALLPFGKEVVTHAHGVGIIDTVFNIVWVILFGIWLALHHVFWAVVCAVTIIGLPFAKQHMKLARLAFTPFGLEIK